MSNLDQLINRFKELTPTRMERFALLVVKLRENVLIDYNTKQLLEGKDSLGVNIDPTYFSENYAEMKLHLNPKGVVDLKLTGDFHRSIFLNANDFPIFLDASDPKTPELLEKYGREVLGIAETNLQEFITYYFSPEFQDLIRNFLQLR